MRGLAGRVAIVTGGGSGIGKATATRLADEGCLVVVADLDAEAANAVVAAIDAAGGQALASLCDVSNVEQCGALVRRTLDAYGGVSILVNNAGGESRDRTGPPETHWDRGIDTTLSSVYRMTAATLPALLACTRSAVVNVSSVNGTRTYGMAEWYAAAKAGITGYTLALAGMHGAQGLRANAVCPGLIKTRRTVTMWQDETKAARHLRHHAVPRFGEPEDVAAAIAFLASEDASFITGQMLTVDGGWGLN